MNKEKVTSKVTNKELTQIEELTLILMYLTSWTEEHKVAPGVKKIKTWNKYIYDTMHKLEIEGYIRMYPKSSMIHSLGITKAKELIEKWRENKTVEVLVRP